MDIFAEKKTTNPTCLNGDAMKKVRDLRQEYLIAYDIEDNKIRTSIYNNLLTFGLKPVQRSVFWGYLSRAELMEVKRNLEYGLNITTASDKAFISKSNFNSHGHNYYIGHKKEDFDDWEEIDVI